MIIERLPEVQSLSDEEKWMLVDELQASLLATSDVEVSDPRIIKDLERRMAEYEANPDSATTWEAIRERLRSKK